MEILPKNIVKVCLTLFSPLTNFERFHTLGIRETVSVIFTNFVLCLSHSFYNFFWLTGICTLRIWCMPLSYHTKMSGEGQINLHFTFSLTHVLERFLKNLKVR